MRLYLDTEFNGFGGDLISLAVVSETGDHWYGIMSSMTYDRKDYKLDPWVKENVIPNLKKDQANIVCESRAWFRASLFQFLDRFVRPTFVVDWYVDVKHLLSLFDGDSHFSSKAYEFDVEFRMVKGGLKSEIPHNALEDAYALRRAKEKLCF